MRSLIEINKISKKYRINANRLSVGTETFRDYIANGIKRVFYKSNVSNDYIWALKDIDLNVNDGDVVGIIGKNGAGKSTLLKVLSRITTPTEGNVIMRGRTASLLEVGTGFHIELTGRENIFLNGAILGLKKEEIKKKFDEIVDFSEIEKFIDTPVKRYSSGMYMRLAFSVAAHLNPEILIVDEVLAVGDYDFQKKCLGKMTGISKSGTTVLFVSHSLSAVKQLCSRAILIDGGRISIDSDVDTAISSYLDIKNDELTGQRDLKDYPRMDCTASDFKFTKINFVSNKAKYDLWESLSVEIEYFNLYKGKDISIGFTIFTFDEYPAFTIDTQDNGISISLEANSYGKVSAMIPEPNLAPGKYFIRLFARSGNTIIDLADRVLNFEVGPGLNTFNAKTAWHGMKAKSVWEIFE